MTGAAPRSPNCGPRRGGARPDIVLLHYTGMATARAALERLCDPQAEVSAHYLLDEDGTLHALVPEELRAWHAGAGFWGGVTDVNSRSVGIEIANPGNRPFPAPQMRMVERLVADIRARWRIPPERVIAHSDIAPERKIDPGPRFDWRGLAQAGQAVWSDEVAEHGAPAPDMDRFGAALDRIGYPPVGAALRLSVFRLRFRPWGTGPLHRDDLARAEDLARRFPVDGVRPGH